MSRMGFVRFVLLAACLSWPDSRAAGQAGAAPEPRPLAVTASTAPLPAPLLPPAPEPFSPVSPSSGAYAIDAEALPKGVAPVIGGVVGALVGFVAMRISCADRFCEMGDLFGILAGAVVGVVIGETIEGTIPTSPRW